MISNTTKNDMKDAAQTLKSDLINDVNTGTQDLRIVADRAGRKARELFDSASNELSHVTENVTTQIRNKPVQSSLMALGAGLLLGMLIRR